MRSSDRDAVVLQGSAGRTRGEPEATSDKRQADRQAGRRDGRDEECQKLNWLDHKGLCLQIKAEWEEKEKRKELGEALFDASLRGDLPEVRRLLALGADARYQLEEGESKGYFPLFVASSRGHVDVIEALIAGGADPNQVDEKSSISSLFVAASHNWPSVIAALVKAGADVNLANRAGGGYVTSHTEEFVQFLHSWLPKETRA